MFFQLIYSSIHLVRQDPRPGMVLVLALHKEQNRHKIVLALIRGEYLEVRHSNIYTDIE